MIITFRFTDSEPRNISRGIFRLTNIGTTVIFVTRIACQTAEPKGLPFFKGTLGVT